MYDPSPVTVAVQNGLDVLQLCVGDHDSALLVDGLPSALVWDLPSHPSSYFLLRAYDTSHVEDVLHGLPAFDIGLAADEPLSAQLMPLLRLFSNGVYEVAVLPRLDMAPPTPEVPAPGTAKLRSWIGLKELPTADAPLVGTVPKDRLDQARIDTLAARIRQGAWPTVVFASSDAAHAAFIVYGHHALEAYRAVGVAPSAVCITAEDPHYLSVQEGCALVRIAFDRCAEQGVEQIQAARARQVLPVGV